MIDPDALKNVVVSCAEAAVSTDATAYYANQWWVEMGILTGIGVIAAVVLAAVFGSYR